MIKIENALVQGWEAAIRGARNPLNSWARSDSKYEDGYYKIGEKDADLMKRLVQSGPDHAKFMRFITVTVDITAPLYWWKQADQYKVGTTTNSCSTMHKIQAKEFVLEDFSVEHLSPAGILLMGDIVKFLNDARTEFNSTKGKYAWWDMIQMLPSAYNQKRTVFLNYAVLRNMYHARKNHKLDEWHDLCDWIESLPQSELITM